jgi:glycosyltransferase involved in cell wall biosynthesis
MPRIAYLTYSTAEYDGRTRRMARTALAAGYDVIVYARWQPGIPLEEDGVGYRVVRVPAVPDLAIPWRRGLGRRRLRDILAGAYTGPTATRPADVEDDPDAGDDAGDVVDAEVDTPSVPRRIARRVVRPIRRLVRRLSTAPFVYPLMLFPVRPLGWAIPLEEMAEPADIWHGMWAGSLPALDRLRARHGGRTVYDSRDVYMRSRGFERMGALKAPFAWLERRWARRADAVLTVNDAYAELLAAQFRIERPPVVRNTPDRYTLPTPRPDLIREALGLSPGTRVILYQGGLLSDRGIEQGMEAMLEIPDAVLAIMGFGPAQAHIEELAASPRYRDRVRMLEPVPPEQLLDWTASADVMLMAIQPTSINHRFTTPQKLWEAIAAGVPVVASDLPGMAEIVRDTGCGILVDATSPADIARGIREIVDASPEERERMRERTWRAGQERYNWEHETDTLLALYRELLDQPEVGLRSPASASTSAT